jgi:hypothetical protein
MRLPPPIPIADNRTLTIAAPMCFESREREGA